MSLCNLLCCFVTSCVVMWTSVLSYNLLCWHVASNVTSCVVILPLLLSHDLLWCHLTSCDLWCNWTSFAETLPSLMLGDLLQYQIGFCVIKWHPPALWHFLISLDLLLVLNRYAATEGLHQYQYTAGDSHHLLCCYMTYCDIRWPILWCHMASCVVMWHTLLSCHILCCHVTYCVVMLHTVLSCDILCFRMTYCDVT